MAAKLKYVALPVAALRIAFAIEQKGGLTASVGKLVLLLLFSLTLIWYLEELGSLTGQLGRGGRIDTETPPVLVSAFGWLILLSIPLLV